MKSIKRRLLGTIGGVILVCGSISISMLIDSTATKEQSVWDVQLTRIASVLFTVLPDQWKVDHTGKPKDFIELQSILLAITLNTLQLVVTGVLVVLAVRRSLRPLTLLEHEIKQRNDFDTSPLETKDVPREILPLVVSLNALLGRLEESTRAERDFLANAAHELRTPLSALHTHAEIARGARSAEQKDAALDKLLKVSERSIRLAEQLLDLARMQGRLHVEASQTDLKLLATYVMDELRLQAQARRVQLTLKGDPVPIQCDVDEVGVLIRNLIDNGIRHGREGGRVEIRCSTVADVRGHWAVLEVIDDGPGVPERERQQIFQRFHRGANADTRGSGIGLALVAGIAELHQGKVETDESQAGGLCIRVWLPMTRKSFKTPD